MDESKKILILLPHEDDEINLIGGLLTNEKFKKYELNFAFVTNGDYVFDANIRMKEAVKSIKKYKINKYNIYFLGYCDQHYDESSHIYMTEEDDVFVSNKNHSETYSNYKIKDYSYLFNQKHSKYNRKSLICDLKDLIFRVLPDVIFINDFDSHPDHRCLTLCFDQVISIILKEKANYHPLIYKGFCYPTAYLGKNDFENINIKQTTFKKENYNNFNLQNPFYVWEDRIRFPVGIASQKHCLLFNQQYQAMKQHKSQLMIRHYKSIINSDQIYWQKNTNNLCVNATITATSGNSQFLNDLILFDCDDIMHGKSKCPIFKNSAWIPLKKAGDKIYFKFSKQHLVKKIKFYQNPSTIEKIKKVKIKNECNEIVEIILENKMQTTYNLNFNSFTDSLEIEILEKEGNNSGFSEIEIFEKEDSKIKYLKILINDNFVYNKYKIKDKLEKLSVYYYDGINSTYLNEDEFNVYVNEKICNVSDMQKYILKKNKIKISLKSNPNIFDEVIILKIGKLYKLNQIIIENINNLIFFVDETLMRIENKIKKIKRK